MPHGLDDSAPHGRSGRGRSRPRGRRRQRRELSPEERVYARAEQRARRKLSFVRQATLFALVMFFLALRGGSLFIWVGLFWGLAIASQAFTLFVAPRLRERWVRQEVAEQVQRQMDAERRAFEGEKKRSLEELSASIAHEIRNPITAAKSLVQQMGEDPASTENVEYAAVALEELERVERSISHLLRYAREEDLKRRLMRIEDAVEGALELLADRIQRMGVGVQRDFDGAGELEADFDMLRRLFLNLLGNALDAFEEAGTAAPRLEISAGESLAGSEVWVRVRDNGPGMDAETRQRAFRPFFTSKANGTGLGLAVSRKLADAHGGTIELTSAPGEGSDFIVTFPRQAAPGADPGRARESVS